MATVDHIAFVVMLVAIQFVTGAHYYVQAPGGQPCSHCDDVITLVVAASNPELYFASNTTLTFLEGTHTLDQDGPVVVSGVSNLTLQGEGVMEEGFHWTVKQSTVIIKCLNSTGSGFVFNNTSVTLMTITFTDCGNTYQNRFLKMELQPYTKGLYSESFNVVDYGEIGASLFFMHCQSVRFGSMSIQNCSGNCLTFFNSVDIVLDSVYVAHNSPERYRDLECCDATPLTKPACIGSNAFFYYLNSPQCIYNNTDLHNFNLSIENSFFSFGAGSIFSKTTLSGITIFNLIVATLNVQIHSVVLYDNAGGNFGAISSYSDFVITNVSSFHSNRYLLQACPAATVGISFKFSSCNEIICAAKKRSDGALYTAANVYVNNSLFEGNTAVDSAGINIDTTFVVDFSNVHAELHFGVENSVIQRNYAPLASCIGSGGFIGFPSRLTVEFRNLLLTNNYFYEPQDEAYIGIPASCIVFVITSFAEIENVTISNQPLLGIFAVASELSFSGKTLIQNNTGVDKGGGIALETNCKIILNGNTNVSLIDNRAKLGAGIYIFQPLVVPLIYQLCLFQVSSGSNSSNSFMYFSGNKASVTGDVIYGGSLDSCLLFTDEEVIPITNLSYIFVIENITVDQRYEISSDAEKLCFCDVSGKSICSETVLTTSPVFPGQFVHFSVVPIGQLGGFTTGFVITEANNYTYRNTWNISIPVCTNTSIGISIENPDIMVSQNPLTDNFSVSFNIGITSTRRPQDPTPKTLVVPINDCPPGFTVNASFICQCDSLLLSDDFVVTCDIISNTLSHSSNIWIGYDSITSNVILGRHCPFDYCKHSTVTFNIIDSPDLQCANHRSGVLCGQCAEGYSLLLGSNECGLCPNNNYLSLLLVFGVAGIALVVLLIALNLTVSVGTINGLIFYANIVKINESIFFPNGSVVILSKFISFINLDFGIKTCFYRGMTPYAKVWLQFVFPVYIWAIIIAIIIASKYSSKVSKIVGSNAVPVLATLMLLSFTKLVRTSILVLRGSLLNYENGSSIYVWSVDGELDYSSADHLFLTIVTVLFFIVVLLPFSIVVTVVPFRRYMLALFSYFCNAEPKKESSRFSNVILRVKPFSDAFSGPLTNENGYWIGLGLVARLVIVSTVPFFDDRASLYIVFFVVLLFLSLFAVVGGAYKQKLMNILEVWSLANLLAITVLALGNTAEVGSYISISLMCATFMMIVGLHIFWQVRKLLTTRTNYSVLASNKKHAVQNEGLMSEMSLSVGQESRYREPLLDYISVD